MDTWLQLFNEEAFDKSLRQESFDAFRTESPAQQLRAIGIATRKIFGNNKDGIVMDKSHPVYNLISAMIMHFEEWRHNCDFEKHQLLKTKCSIVYDELYENVTFLGDEESAEAMINLINHYEDIIDGYNEEINEFLLPSSSIDRHLLDKPSQP